VRPGAERWRHKYDLTGLIRDGRIYDCSINAQIDLNFGGTMPSDDRVAARFNPDNVKAGLFLRGLDYLGGARRSGMRRRWGR